ncbi:MAG: hypothetical protein ABI082_02240 [Dokdonella sp.]
MIKQSNPKFLLAVVAIVLLSACAFANARTAAPAKAKAAEVAAPVGTPAAYDALEHHVGDELVIETTLNTVRRGKLVKYTNPGLTIELGPEHGSIELSVPRETIRSIRVLPTAAPAAVGAQRSQGSDSAQKN